MRVNLGYRRVGADYTDPANFFVQTASCITCGQPMVQMQIGKSDLLSPLRVTCVCWRTPKLIRRRIQNVYKEALKS